MNDWLAFAPVFSESDTVGVSLTTKELQRYFKTGDSSSVRRRSLVLTKGRTGITPLPGTENEVKSILKEYEKNKLEGKVLLHSLASKSFLKSDEAKNYRVLHFATHGFVNPETPELSGILFAGDASGGILSCGEIYNLTLNADLVVLSTRRGLKRFLVCIRLI
jgi:CHAT domain-containing protein